MWWQDYKALWQARLDRLAIYLKTLQEKGRDT
jgi:hypothetical protein